MQSSIPLHIELDDGQYLSQHPDFTFFPTGIIDKSDTNIGATHAELTSKRNSILAFPSRSIAYNKYLQDRNKYFYVGSLEGDNKITEEQIQKYHRNVNIRYKKFLVVANSLPRLMRAIGIDEAYTKYFFFFDEIDKFQTESTFRSELEYCIDYFLDPSCTGCLISATVGAFSNPQLKKLPISTIRRKHNQKEPLSLYRIANKREEVLKFLYKRFKQHPKEKFLVAHKSTKQIMYLINHLDIEKRKDVSVLCGESSKDSVGDTYRQLENDLLPSRMNFMTSAYFSGVDIKERYHLILVSDESTPFSLLTLSEIRQIAGRCRDDDRHYSLSMVIPDTKIEIIPNTKTSYTDKARSLAKSANIHTSMAIKANIDPHTHIDFTNQTKDDVTLIRQGIDGYFTVSSFTIDQYMNRQSDLLNLYGAHSRTTATLGRYFLLSYGKRDFTTVSVDRLVKTNFLLASQNAMELPEPKNDVEKKVYNRIKICRQGNISGDKRWLIDNKYWHKTSFKKRYIEQYVEYQSSLSSIWEMAATSFSVGSFYASMDLKQNLMKIIEQLSQHLEITNDDYVAVLEGLFEIMKTRKDGVNGYKLLKLRESKSGEIYRVPMPNIRFEGI